MRIVHDENMPGLDGLAVPGVSLLPLPGRAISRLDLASADALLVRSVTRVDEALLAGTPVRFVGTATAGTDHVDRAALAALGIGFADAAGANANAVVEYVLAAVAATGKVLERLLAGGRVGIAGFGHVGRALARRLDALGIDWCASDPWLPAGSIPRPAALATVLGSDVVTLHVSLVDRAPWPSRHLLARDELARLSADVLLINASRGPVIDNRALADWIGRENGSVALDVWETEPDVPADLLAAVAIATPHIAGYSLDARLAGTERVLGALDAALGTALAGELRPTAAEPLALPRVDDPVLALRELLLARYDPRRDTALLREALASAGDRRGAVFDRLRRDYGVRRELAGSPVAGGSATARELALALGGVPID